MDNKSLFKDSRGQTGGLISGLVFGVAGLVIGVIIAFVVISTLTTSNLITDVNQNASVGNLSSNFTAGINNVSSKIPTVLLVAAIVLILGVLAVLVGVWQRMRMGGSL